MNLFTKNLQKQHLLSTSLMKQAENFCLKCNRHGFSIKPHNGSQTYRNLIKLSSSRLEEVIKTFEAYFHIVARTARDGIDLKDDKLLSWHALKLLGLRPLSDIFDKIERGDVVEFYNTDYIQIFRNMRFFDLCSYPLVDILTYEWPDLYERNPAITENILKDMKHVHRNGGATRTFEKSAYYEHEMWERFSDRKYRFNCRLMYISPLFIRGDKSRKPAGSIVVCRAERVGER